MCNQGGAVLEKRGRDGFLSVSFMLDYSTVRVSSPTPAHVSSTVVGHGLIRPEARLQILLVE
jgi:hypothetical protein